LTTFSNFVKNTEAFSEKLNYDFLVFEGGQGLMLDKDWGDFPHVTRSRTGLTNIKNLFFDTGIELDTVIYVMRAYMTRHGAGPFPNEEPKENYPKVIDHTNKTNEFQGSLRFPTLDFNKIVQFIEADSWENGYHRSLYMMTCLDQLNDKVKLAFGDDIHILDKQYFIDSARRINQINSYGPTRDHVIKKGGVSIV